MTGRSLTTGTTRALLALTVTAASAAVVVAEPTADAAAYHPYGSTSAPRQTMRNGCRNYVYSYKITPPTPQWSAEIFLINPNKHSVSSANLDVASDPIQGKRHWYLCRNSTVSGRYTMKMRVTYTDGSTVRDGMVKPSHFYLVSRRGR